MNQSIAQQFAGAIGPAFDEDDLVLILDSSDRLIFSSASSHHGVPTATEAVIAMIHRTHPLQNVIGIAALLQAPRDVLLAAVRALTELLRHAHPSDFDLVAGGVATGEKATLEITVSIWVRMR